MNTTKLSKYNNDWYNPGRGLIIRICWLICSYLIVRNPLIVSSKIKKFILILFGSKIGNGFVIRGNVNIKYPWNLIIGNNVWIGEEVWIDNLALVVIQSNVCISQNAFLLCGNHNYKRSAFDLIVGEIVLQNGVWLGAKSIVCGGVTCYSHSVLSVNSVATKNLEQYSIYTGNPAIKVRDRVID